MKLKEIERTATPCWAPFTFQQQHRMCPLIATGSVAGALDATFSSTAELEIFAIDLEQNKSTKDGILRLGGTTSSARFSRLAWSAIGAGSTDKPFGVIAAGMEDGHLDLWNAAGLMQNKENALVQRKQVHATAVKALDFNPYQSGLLATGAANAEIYIWDLNNPEKPFTPGVKSQRLQDVTSVAWNRQVQHILASAANNGCSVIWDLKNRREIIHLATPNSKKPITAIAWNPDVATQILTASEDDDAPVIYMWDLRNAHAPEKVLTGHSKGVLSVAWSAKDSELLLSCGKDNRTLCWNPSSCEIMGEFPTSNNWVFDVQWCPRNPDLLSTSSFDGKISIYTIQAKSTNDIPLSPTSATDPFTSQIGMSVGKAPPFTLKQPPKWMRRPISATFGFGNKLVSFSSIKKDPNVNSRVVSIRSVFPVPELNTRVQQLHIAMNSGDFTTLCQDRIQTAKDESEVLTWKFLESILLSDARNRIVSLLGLDQEKFAKMVAQLNLKDVPVEEPVPVVESSPSNIVQEVVEASMNQSVPDLFAGSKDEFSLQPVAPAAEIAPIASYVVFSNQKKDDVDSVITRAIMVADFAGAVDVCLKSGRLDDALLFASCGGSELMERTRKAYFAQKKNLSYVKVLSSLMSNRVDEVVANANVANDWRELLAMICTYAKVEEFPKLTMSLADRLRNLSDTVKDAAQAAHLKHASVLVYMACGNLERVLSIWTEQLQNVFQRISKSLNPNRLSLYSSRDVDLALQSFVEKVTTLRKAIGHSSDFVSEEADPAQQTFIQLQRKSLQQKYAIYAGVLANHGKLASALMFLDLAPEAQIAAATGSEQTVDLVGLYKHRIYSALKREEAVSFGAAPPVPFDVTAVKAAVVKDVGQEFFNQIQNQPDQKVTPKPSPQKYTPNGTAPAAQPPAYPGYNYQPAAPQAAPSQYQPQQYVAQPQQAQQPQATAYNPYQQYYPQQQQVQQAPAQPAAPSAPPAGPRSLIPQPQPIMTTGGTVSPQQQSPMSPGNSGPVPAAQQRNLGGFNDPPADIFAGKKRISKQPSAAPITQPLVPSSPTRPQSQVYGAPQQTGPAPVQPPPAGVSAPAPMAAMRQQSMPQQSAYQPAPAAYQQPQQGYQPAAPVQQGYAPQSVQPVAVAPQPVATPEKQRHPMGDRSHILPEQKPIYESLSRLLNNCKPNASPAQKKMLDDAEKRLNILFDKLNNEEVGTGAVGILLGLVKAVEARDWNTAGGAHQTLMTSHSSEGTNWILGVRRLIDTAKTLQF